MINNADTIKKVRSMLALTKTGAAEKVGCTPKTYAKYEKEGVKDSDMIKIISAMGAHVESRNIITITVQNYEPMTFVNHIALP